MALCPEPLGCEVLQKLWLKLLPRATKEAKDGFVDQRHTAMQSDVACSAAEYRPMFNRLYKWTLSRITLHLQYQQVIMATFVKQACCNAIML